MPISGAMTRSHLSMRERRSKLHVRQAIRVRSSYALTANAMVAVVAEDGESALAFAREALECAVDAQDWWAFTHAALWEANAVETWAAEVAADMLRRRREQMQALGAPHPYLAWVSASEAARMDGRRRLA